MGPFDFEPFLFELPQEIGEQAIVPSPGGGERTRQGGQPYQVGLEFSKIGPGDAARETDRLATGGSQGRKGSAEFGETDLASLKGLKTWVCEPAHAQNEQRPPDRLTMSGQAHGQKSAACD
jgi:hypothetical protein